MKLALCLSGEVRTWEYCNHTIETAFPNCEVDIYATMWTRSSYVDQNKVLARKPKKVYLISEDDSYEISFAFWNYILDTYISKHAFTVTV